MKQKNVFNIDKLLKPYEEGGTEGSPVKRTLSTIASKLIVGNNIPPEIVGAAIFKVFQQMAHNGLEFRGDGTYGSKGRDSGIGGFAGEVRWCDRLCDGNWCQSSGQTS